jgi:RNA polymerase sigma-70 factor (ECF subfamily)
MDPAPPPDDLPALLARVRGGDEAALAELLRRYEPRILTAARVLLGPLLRPHLDTLDLVQSVHRTLLPGLRDGRYDLADGDGLVALALTVIRRKVADTWRRAKRRGEAPVGDAGWDSLSDDSAPDPAEAAQAGDAVRRVLAELDGPERRLVELRLAGLGTSEIAAKLGCDAHALRARLSRLRRRLREAGGEEWL